MIETGGGAGSNTVISPAMFEEFCLPYDIRQHALIRNLDPDIAISYHTCGGDIREGVDEVRVKEILGSRVKLMGGINQIQVLTQGSKEDIFRDVERAFKGYGRDGGYIMMASDHFFHAPKSNLIHYANAVKEICKY